MAEDDEIDASSEDMSEPVPGVVGTLVAASNSAPVRALLSPAMTVLGRYWGERMDEITQEWKRKRKENIENKFERVASIEADLASQTINETQAILLAEWYNGASTTDDESPELNAMWEGVLSVILKKDTESKRLISIAGQLSEDDVNALFAIYDGKVTWKARLNFRIGRLEELGLAYRRSAGEVLLRTLWPFCCIGVLSLVFFGLGISKFIFGPQEPLAQSAISSDFTNSIGRVINLSQIPFVFLSVSALVMPLVISFNIVNARNEVRLTLLGMKLVGAVRRYSQRTPKR